MMSEVTVDYDAFYSLLGHAQTGGLTPVVALIPNPKNDKYIPKRAYIKSGHELEEFARKYDGKGQCYIALNPVRSNIDSHADHKDEDVTHICNILIDIDPDKSDSTISDKEIKKYAATDSEKDKAVKDTDVIAGMLKENNFTFYRDDSGNGNRIILAIEPILLTDENRPKIKELLKAVQYHIQEETKIKIDTSVHDFRRITGIPGTLNLKKETETRKNRMRIPASQIPARVECSNFREFIFSLGKETKPTQSMEHADLRDGLTPSPDLTNSEVLSLLMGSRLAKSFEDLYDGILSEYGNDASVCDYHFCKYIAFYTQKPKQIEEIARGSKLVRDKWDREDGYFRKTISEAIRKLTATYQPGRAPISEEKEQKPIDWKTPLKQAVMDTQDADHDARIHAAKDILFNVLAEMSPIARRETFLECVCKDLKLSNRAANDIYKNFEINTNPLNRCEWFTEKGKFVPPVMSDQIRGQYHFITLTDTKEIWVYDDKTGCYKPGGDVVIKQYAQQALDKHSKKSHIEETVYHVMNETFEDRSVFDSNPECINLQNGIYNIRTCMFEDHRPSVMFTYALPFKYDPNAVCSKFDDLLANCGVNKTLIYEIFAYCLVPGYPIQSLFIFSGDGGNGKGTVIRVLRRFLGEENIVGHSMQALEKNRYALADLFGKLANICGDMPPTDVRDTSPIKTTTGGDAITAPVIYKGNITFENRAKMIFLLNHVPEFDDNTDSFDRRLVFQEFNNRVVGLDENFNEADLWTEEELSGIFNKCIEVLPDLLARGSFTGKMGIQETREYRQRKGNPIAAFVEDCTNYDDMKFSVAAETYAAYLKWCTQNHETCLTENVFGRKLLEKFPEYKKSRPTIDGSRVYCYNGFVLKEEYQKLNISEEAEKYVKSKDVVQDTQGMSRIGPGTVQDKNSDFSDTIDGNGVFGLGCSPKLSVEKNKNENDKEKDNANFPKEDCASILDTSQKEATDNESILDGSWTDPGPNPDLGKDIEDSLNQWEKSNGPIYGKRAIYAAMEIGKALRLHSTEYTIVEAAAKKRSAGRCVDCGADHKDYGTSQDGKVRCKACYDIYSNPPPVKIPEEFSLEDPAEVTP